MLLLYILAAYIATFTVAMYQLERLHGKCDTTAPDTKTDDDALILRALYMTLPVCYYISLFYGIWWLVCTVSEGAAAAAPAPA